MKRVIRRLFGGEQSKPTAGINDVLKGIITDAMSEADALKAKMAEFKVTISQRPEYSDWKCYIDGPDMETTVTASTEDLVRRYARERIESQVKKASTVTIRGDEL